MFCFAFLCYMAVVPDLPSPEVVSAVLHTRFMSRTAHSRVALHAWRGDMQEEKQVYRD